MEQNKTRNRLILYYIKLDGGKTLTHIKKPIRQVTGKKINKVKMRPPVVDWPTVESFKAKSIEHAHKIFSGKNIKVIKSAIYFDNEGHQYPIYVKKDEQL